ncbi:MAG: hypothetical protein ACNA8W_06445 [Bradymonadaceae bacterium]
MNRAVIREALTKVFESYRLELLYRAVDRLPEEHLRDVFGELIKYCDEAELAAPAPDLFEEVVEFVEQSRAGRYYEDYEPNSRTSMEQSEGTNRWIAQCCRLLGHLVEATSVEPPEKVLHGFDEIIGLLRQLDWGDDSIVFFTDEGGSWQVGVKWPEVVAACAACLAASEEPEACARRALTLIDEFDASRRNEMVEIAAERLPPQYGAALSTMLEEDSRGR